MIAKIVVVIFLLIILYSLGSALYYLIKDRSESDHVIVALTWRISLSIFLFVLLFVMYAFGWIVPHGV